HRSLSNISHRFPLVKCFLHFSQKNFSKPSALCHPLSGGGVTVYQIYPALSTPFCKKIDFFYLFSLCS
ncbi:MAG: hypothetical protein IKC69_00110, partial [Clostridia bacterium]|nr:hypothetical protein [Clostridia bacterium]